MLSFGSVEWSDKDRFLAMANFNEHFLDSDDDLSLLTQEDRNVENNEVPIDMEDLLNSSRDSAVRGLANFNGNKTLEDECDHEVISVSERCKPITEDTTDSEQ